MTGIFGANASVLINDVAVLVGHALSLVEQLLLFRRENLGNG